MDGRLKGIIAKLSEARTSTKAIYRLPNHESTKFKRGDGAATRLIHIPESVTAQFSHGPGLGDLPGRLQLSKNQPTPLQRLCAQPASHSPDWGGKVAIQAGILANIAPACAH
jgi:hypothetical protein